MTAIRITGGCQCGAVRYALHQQPHDPHICHCRMCQKAFGSYFAPLAGVLTENFEITRGRLAIFMSSDQTERGFCRDCGTPLTFHYVHSKHTAIALGSLDEPEKIRPEMQHGVEGRMSWFAQLAGLPGEAATEDEEPELAGKIAASNHQHPDHDTENWDTETRPPEGTGS